MTPPSSACIFRLCARAHCVSSVIRTQDLSPRTMTAGEWLWMASPHLRPPRAIRHHPRASLRAGWHEELHLSGWQEGVAETHRSWFLHNLCQHQGLSPSHVKPAVLSPNPERSAIIDLASGPYPSGAKATAQFTGWLPICPCPPFE